MPSVHSPKENWLPTQTSLLVTPPASPTPPGFPPLPPGFYHSRPPRGLPRYPCSICSLDVGKDSLKCSTCSKWVHFSCSSLTRADFRKIFAAGSPMGWNCPACLNKVLVSPTHRPASPPASSLQLCPHPHALHLLAQILWIHLCLYPHILPFLTFALLPPSSFLPHHHSFTAGPQLATAPSRKSTPLTQSQNSAMNAGGLSSSSRAELIAFLSGNHYDLILLQETHLSSTKTFQIPDYYTLRTDRTFGRQGPVSSGTHNTGGVLTLIHSDLAFSPVSVSSLSSQDPYSDYTCVKVLLSNHSPLQFLNLYSPLIRNSPSDSRTWTFYPDILPNSPDSFILEDFNAHYPTWTDSFPLTRSEMTCFAGSLPRVWKF